MYRSFYEFRSDPFGVMQPSSPLYLSETHREALATLVDGVLERRPFVAILGEVGVGKSTVLKAALERVRSEPVTLVEASHPRIGPDKMTQMLADAVGVPGGEAVTIQDIDLVDRALCANAIADAGKRVTFVIDQAQLLPPDTLEFIRLVSNMAATRAGFLQFLLIGRTEFRDILASHEFRLLGQRIAIRCAINPLSDTAARDYIDFRLRMAGASGPQTMTADAIEELLRAAKGIPRRINVIADKALSTGYGLGVRPVTAKIMRDAIKAVDGDKKWMSGPMVAAFVTAVTVGGWGLGATLATLRPPPAALTAQARAARPMPVVAMLPKQPVPVTQSTASPRPLARPASSTAVARAAPAPVPTIKPVSSQTNLASSPKALVSSHKTPPPSAKPVFSEPKPAPTRQAATPSLAALDPSLSAPAHAAPQAKLPAHPLSHHNKSVAVMSRLRAGSARRHPAAVAPRDDEFAASGAQTDDRRDAREPLQRPVAVAGTDAGDGRRTQTDAGETGRCRGQLIRYCLSMYASWNMPPTLARCIAANEPGPGVTPAWYSLRKVIRAGTIPPLADYTRCLAGSEAARAIPRPRP